MYKYEYNTVNLETGQYFYSSDENKYVWADGIVQALMQLSPLIAGQPVRVTAIFEVGGGD